MLVVAAEEKNSTDFHQRQALELEEVVVTAEKVQESELNVPVSMSVLTGNKLVNSRAFRFQDFLGQVAGVSLVNEGNNYGNEIVIRGLDSGNTLNPSTVAVYMNDTPLPDVAGRADVDTFDMTRIEVLKGPQGTLYGENALSGLLKYVTNPPELREYHVSAEAGPSFVQSGGTGSDAHAMLNVPIGSEMAIRLVGYNTYYAGFVNDPSRARKAINGTRDQGGRASLLWKPSDKFSFNTMAMYQERKSSNPDFEQVEPDTLNPVYGNLIAKSVVDQPSESVLKLVNATLKYGTSVAEVLSTTSYSSSNYSSFVDKTEPLGAVVSKILGAPYGLAERLNNPETSLTEELRISSSMRDRLRWLVGGFFTSQNGGPGSDKVGLWPIDLATRDVLYGFSEFGGLGLIETSTHYREFAGYAHLDYDITPSITAAVGGRYTSDTQSSAEKATGLFGGGRNLANTFSEHVVTYEADVSWRPSADTMVYFRTAEGYQPGGVNLVIALRGNVPGTYSSSTDYDYEVGVKSRQFGGRAELEADAFHILWKSLQLPSIVNSVSTTVNVSAAQSDGIEANLKAHVPPWFVVTVASAYTKARLTEPTPADVGGSSGERLPHAPRWGASVGAEYDRELTGNYEAFAAVDWRFIGTQQALFTTVAQGPRQVIPASNVVDVRVGVEAAHWHLTVYAKNVANERAITDLVPATPKFSYGPQQAYLETPRTIGLTVGVEF